MDSFSFPGLQACATTPSLFLPRLSGGEKYDHMRKQFSCWTSWCSIYNSGGAITVQGGITMHFSFVALACSLLLACNWPWKEVTVYVLLLGFQKTFSRTGSREGRGDRRRDNEVIGVAWPVRNNAGFPEKEVETGSFCQPWRQSMAVWTHRYIAYRSSSQERRQTCLSKEMTNQWKLLPSLPLSLPGTSLSCQRKA